MRDLLLGALLGGLIGFVWALVYMLRTGGF